MENSNRPPITSASSDYPNASFTNTPAVRPTTQPKPARQRQEAVVSKDQVMRKKQNAFRRAQHRLVTGDGKSLMDYVIDDVLVPTLKSTFVDVISNGADILMYGEPRHGRPGNNGTRITRGGINDNYTPYRNISSPRPSTSVRSGNSATGLRDKLALDDFVFTTRTAAADVLDRMSTLIDDYGMVSVLNLYDFCDMTCPFTYDDYVWTDLSTVAIKPIREGWLLSLPTPHLKG